MNCKRFTAVSNVKVWISQALLINFLEGKIVFMGEIPEIPPETQLTGCITFENPVYS